MVTEFPLSKNIVVPKPVQVEAPKFETDIVFALYQLIKDGTLLYEKLSPTQTKIVPASPVPKTKLLFENNLFPTEKISCPNPVHMIPLLE